MCARERRDKMSGKKVPHESDFKAGCNLCVISFFFFFFFFKVVKIIQKPNQYVQEAGEKRIAALCCL